MLLAKQLPPVITIIITAASSASRRVSHLHTYMHTHAQTLSFRLAPARNHGKFPSLCPFPPNSTCLDSPSSPPSPPSPPQATGVEAADEVGSSFSQFKLQRAPYNLRYIIYVIKDDKIQIEKEGARGKGGREGGKKGGRSRLNRGRWE